MIRLRFMFGMHRCLLCKCYSAGASVLSSEANEVDPSKTALTATDFLLYCYYGARIHIGDTLPPLASSVFASAPTLVPVPAST